MAAIFCQFPANFRFSGTLSTMIHQSISNNCPILLPFYTSPSSKKGFLKPCLMDSVRAQGFKILLSIVYRNYKQYTHQLIDVLPQTSKHTLCHTRATEIFNGQLSTQFWAMFWAFRRYFSYELRSIGSKFVCLNDCSYQSVTQLWSPELQATTAK